jgi:hypothetical protein
VIDPANPVAQVFLMRCGIHPATQPRPPKPEEKWKPAAPDLAAQFRNPAPTFGQRAIDEWWYWLR